MREGYRDIILHPPDPAGSSGKYQDLSIPLTHIRPSSPGKERLASSIYNGI